MTIKEVIAAVKKKDIAKLKQLLESENKIDLNTPPRNAVTTIPLVEAVLLDDNKEIIQLLIKHGANVNQTVTQHHYTPLTSAAASGKLDNVKLLIENGADISLMTKISSAFKGAVTYKKVDVYKYLLEEKKADVNAITKDGATALYAAVKNRDKECIIYLLDKGAKADLCDVKEQYVPLVVACEAGPVEVVQLLIKHGADVNRQCPLYTACYKAEVDIVKLLVEGGANVNQEKKQRSQQLSPLFGAVSSSCKDRKKVEDIVQCLLGHKANSNVLCGYETPLTSAVSNGSKDEKIVELLLEHGAKPALVNQRGNPPLYIAATRGTVKTMGLLLKYGSDANIKNIDGNTPLHDMLSSISLDSLDAVELLLNAGADPNIENKKKNTAFSGYTKSRKARAAEIKLLVEKGAQVNAQDKFGSTVLSEICGLTSTDALSICQILVGHGADVNIADNNKVTPLHRATDSNQEPVVEYLLQQGAAHTPNKDGRYAFHSAYKSIEMLNLFMATKAIDINVIGERGSNMLHYAVTGFNGNKYYAERHLQVIRYLISNGCDKNCMNIHRKTPLDIAKSEPKYKAVLEAMNDTNMGTPLVIAMATPPKPTPAKSLPPKSTPPKQNTTTSKSSVTPKSKQQTSNTPTKLKSDTPSEKTGVKKESTMESNDVNNNSDEDDQEEWDVMLSYNWDNQDKVIKIKDQLEKKGIKVWMDLDRMEGAMNDRMAEAVAFSKIIILCLSKKYALSKNCNKEFRYADTCDSIIIPVKMDSSYVPKKGTALSLILSDHLWYDLDTSFTENIPKVVKAVERKLKEVGRCKR